MMTQDFLQFSTRTTFSHYLFKLCNKLMIMNLNQFAIVLLYSSLLILIARFYRTRTRRVYLVDFECYKPKDSLKCSYESFNKRSKKTGIFSDESLLFQNNILEKSGLGPSTYLPESLLRLEGDQNQSMEEARKETESVIFGAVDNVLLKTRVLPSDIGILVVNSSLFNPSPSLCSTIINRYGLKSSILSYNLAGMGCSASITSVDLAKQLLQVHSNSYALVVSTENITLNWYLGNKRSMLLPNCLFRMGGAAILLSNRPADRHTAKYQLAHICRVNKGNDDRSYKSTYQEEDNNGTVGLSLSKELGAVVEEALKTNLVMLSPLVLPISERLLYLANLIGRKLFLIQMKPYLPDFKLAFEHFCIHPGGRALLDKLEKSFKLSEWQLEPSRMTLYRFGNTSSSSVWYELSYSEAKGRVKKGDRVWQVGLGAGFECNSAVWKTLRTIDPVMWKNLWMDDEGDIIVPHI